MTSFSPTARPLADILHAVGRPHLLVVGDIVVDQYQRGPVERISPEAPIPVLRVDDTWAGLGCAASVAQIAAVLEADVTLIGVVGEDAPKGVVTELASAAGVRFLPQVDPTRPTSVKTRYLAHSHSTHQQVLRVDHESTEPVSEAIAAQVVSAALEVLPTVDALVLSDYGKGCLPPVVLAALIKAAREARTPVLVDPKGRDFSRYAGATAITPNRPETAQATGLPVTSVEEAEAAAAALCTSLQLDFALVTLDREGMYLRRHAGPGVHLPTTPREVFDVTGAGDMVLAVLATALASGAEPEDAAQLANLAAGLAVERVGVATVTRAEIAERLSVSVGTTKNKIVPFADAAALGLLLRAQGRQVVFTNGCFDILHAGHVAYLQAAKDFGDVLVLGLNADASVSRLKGPSRPIQSEADRAQVLAALDAVDHVIVFEADTPLALIEAVKPDVLVKGADWKEKGVVGREFVEANGGRVEFAALVEGRSTTDVVARIRDLDAPA